MEKTARTCRYAGPALIGVLVTFSAYVTVLSSGKWPLHINQYQSRRTEFDVLRTWAQFPGGVDDDTSKAQLLLGEYQNPKDCQGRRYFLWAPLNYGMGADIHIIGLAMGFAVHYNRTLVYHPQSDWIYTSPDVCNNTATPDCFFRPLSECQWLANAQKGIDFPVFDKASTEWEHAQFVDLTSGLNIWVEHEFIPRVADWPSRTLSWWRSQTTRYIVRPLPSLHEWTTSYFSKNLQRYPPLPEWDPRSHSPPDRAICIHVRHGDKGGEMSLHPMEDYLAAASNLTRNIDAPRSIFLTTDDPLLIGDVEGGLYNQWGLTFYYTRYERPTETLSPMVTASRIGRGEFGRISLANLILAVHPACAAFIQTTGSNWNRLVNEIRKTDGTRHAAPWVDLEPFEWRRR